MDYSKKLLVVAKLLAQRYEGKIDLKVSPKTKAMCVRFENKPDQEFVLTFPAFDTWDEIKRKMDKLVESDGICVVCCEMEKPKKTRKRVKCEGGCDCIKYAVSFELPVGYCQTCCEMLCKSCWEKMTTNKCPVCRTCIATYKHKAKEEECHCEDDYDE